MTQRPHRRLAGGLLAGALALSGLAIAAPATAETTAGSSVRVWINKQHEVKMVDQLRPGVHRIVLRSGQPSALQIMKARRGYTKTEAVRDAARMFESVKAMKRFERNITLWGGVSARSGEPGVMWAKLPRGRYWVVDTMPDRIQVDDVKVLRVKGARVAGDLPGAKTLRAVSTHGWADSPATMPASGRVVLRNSSDANHMYGLARLADGKTVDDFAAWVEELKKGNETPPPVSWDTGVEAGLVSPGGAMSLKYDLPAGDYVLVCWWPDTSMGNMPHVFMGMFKGVTLK